LLGIGACLGAGVIGSVIVTLYVSVLEYFQVFIPAPDLSLSSGAPIATVLLLIYGCLLGPILEEVIFRGFFLKFLQRFGSAFAIVFSAILFSLFHMNTIQLVPPFLIGLILGFVTVQSKSIVPAIIIHGVNNGVCFLMDEGFSNPEMLSFWIANSIFLVCAIGSLIVFIVLYRKKISGLFLWEKQTLPMGKGLAKAFSTPLIIVYLGIYIGTIVVPFVITNL
ncbi:MAG: CPBP family intramembrane glutamic endopeptidase, partial [Oscillospiraceae bacterium]